jgi:hypothetical protein
MKASLSSHLSTLFRSTVLLLILAHGTTGCASARMAVPPSLASVPALPVSGRQGWKLKESLGFGSFQVTGVQRSWTRGSDLQVDAYERNRRRQSFQFQLSENGTELLSAKAQVNLRRQAVDVGADLEWENQSRLEVQFQSANPALSEGGVLVLQEQGERPLSGTLTWGSRVIQVTGTDRLAGTPLPLGTASGYLLTWEGRDVAAVDVIDAGQVRLADGLETSLRAQLAATAAALLLLEDLRESLPD